MKISAKLEKFARDNPVTALAIGLTQLLCSARLARDPVRFPLAPGVCAVCGCTDRDCSQCIKRTGRPCRWANQQHTLCSACANAMDVYRTYLSPIDVQRFADGSFRVGRRGELKFSSCSSVSTAKAALTRWKKRYPGSPVNGEELLAQSS